MKIFAYDKKLSHVTLDDIKPHLHDEIKYAWDLYKKGIIREIYFRADNPGAVLVLECESISEAKQTISELPLVKAGLIEFEFIPVGPFVPFENLFAK